MAHGVKLRRYGMITPDPTRNIFRIRIEVIDFSGDIDGRIFLFKRSPVNPYTSTYSDNYMCVCAPVDMAEYPPGAPDPEKPYPFFRSHMVEADLRNMADIEKYWELVKSDVCQLMQSLDLAADLKVIEDFNCGELPKSDASSSISING